jgi:hypothetical protein
MPTAVGRSKSQMFNYLQEKIWKKLKGCGKKKTYLLLAGKFSSKL